MSYFNGKIEGGITKAFENGDNFKSYLKVVANFNPYSTKNTLAIYAQNPEATKVASFDRWKADGQSVKRGEKGIEMFIATGKEEDNSLRYTIGKVFDISQTHQKTKQEAEVGQEAVGIDTDFAPLVDVLRKTSPVPVWFESFEKISAQDYTPAEGVITVMKGMPPEMTAASIISGIAEVNAKTMFGENADVTSQYMCQHAVDVILCEHFGLAAPSYSFEYVTEWAQDVTPDILEERLGAIHNASKDIISDVRKKQWQMEQIAASKEDNAQENIAYVNNETKINGNVSNEKANNGQDLAQADESKSTILPPDPTITSENMNDYGYAYDGTLPLNKDRAIELFNLDNPVMLLYSDDTEAYAESLSDIENHDGIFGIEKMAWQNAVDNGRDKAVAVAESVSEQSPEALYVNLSLLNQDTGMDVHYTFPIDRAEILGEYKELGFAQCHTDSTITLINEQGFVMEYCEGREGITRPQLGQDIVNLNYVAEQMGKFSPAEMADFYALVQATDFTTIDNVAANLVTTAKQVTEGVVQSTPAIGATENTEHVADDSSKPAPPRETAEHNHNKVKPDPANTHKSRTSGRADKGNNTPVVSEKPKSLDDMINEKKKIIENRDGTKPPGIGMQRQNDAVLA